MKLQFVVLAGMLGSVSQCFAVCQNKPPMADYSPDLVEGKFYLIEVKVGLPHQKKETACGTAEVKSASPKTFDYCYSGQAPDGRIQSGKLIVTNIPPPGAWNVTSADGSNGYLASVIGAKKGLVHVIHGCSPKSGGEAVWVYYKKRVNGFSQMDSESQKYVQNTLSRNNIDSNGLETVNNNNCSN